MVGRLIRSRPGERRLLSPLPFPLRGRTDRRHGRGAGPLRLRRTPPALRRVEKNHLTRPASHRNPRRRHVTIAFRPLVEARAGRSDASDLPDGAIGLFSHGRLDDPNQIEIVQEFRVTAQAISAVLAGSKGGSPAKSFLLCSHDCATLSRVKPA